MRELSRYFSSLRRRLRQKISDGRPAVLAGRWLALALLLGGVAALGVWGGAGEPGGVNGLLQDTMRPADNLQTAAVEKPAEKKGPAPAAAGPVAEINTDVAAVPKAAEQAETATEEDAAEEDAPEVYDNAPEPWVGNAVLQAEADLFSLGAPLANFGGGVLRPYGYSFDESFGDYRFHRGVDFQAEEGRAVLAALAGEVAEVTRDDIHGDGVVLRCGEKLQLVYYGLKPAANLQAGDKLAPGDKLGEVCKPPLFEDAYPAHLHLEILLDAATVDPADYGLGS